MKNSLKKNRIKMRSLDNKDVHRIKKGLKKADELSFVTDSDQKYPIYVYASVEKEDENNWIMYYINGNLYAVNGFYYVSNASSYFNEERKVIIDYPKVVVSEKDGIITYNPKTNRFVKAKNISDGYLRYYAKGNNEISLFVDYPEETNSEYKFFSIEVVDKIDENLLRKIDLDNYRK